MFMARAYAEDDVIYPESDGMPMAEKPVQGRVIRTLVTGFERLYADDESVFVAGDFFWYPVRGNPKINAAPDVTIIEGIEDRTFGAFRPWAHGGRVSFVVEVLSPSNTWREMARKQQFYDEHGVDEYWVFDPDDGYLQVWVRDGERLVGIADPDAGWTSPVTGVHVSVVDNELQVVASDGRPFRTPLEETLENIRLHAEREQLHAEQQRMHTEQERLAEENERLRAELERLRNS